MKNDHLIIQESLIGRLEDENFKLLHNIIINSDRFVSFCAALLLESLVLSLFLLPFVCDVTSSVTIINFLLLSFFCHDATSITNIFVIVIVLSIHYVC